jgi:hypothetical protein
VKGQLDFPDGIVEDYEPASRAFCFAQARSMLERLYGVGLERLPASGVGDCDDCGREAELLVYGSVEVCRRCALIRRRAGQKAGVTDPYLRRLHRPELEELAAGDDEHAERARAELERRRLNRQRRRNARAKAAPTPPEQMSVDEEIDAKEGFDGWDIFDGEEEPAA